MRIKLTSGSFTSAEIKRTENTIVSKIWIEKNKKEIMRYRRAERQMREAKRGMD